MLIAQVYLCRHGETEENKAKILQGQLNTMLNESGVRQAGLLAQRFKEARIDLAFSSDLSRAVKVSLRRWDDGWWLIIQRNRRLKSS